MNEITLRQEESTKWLEDLALDELNMDESGIINFGEHINPSHLLEESSIGFMNELRDLFEIYVTKFNEYRGGTANLSQIKIFKISNTVNDFMLFRNSLRLIFNRRANDLITIGFIASNGELLSARMSTGNNHESVHEIKAHLGPFNNITWRFHGETVATKALVRHYLSEFIKNSAR